MKDDQWTQVQKAGNSNQGPRKKGKGKYMNGDVGKSQADGLPKAPSNPFAVLSPPEDFLEEGEVQKFEEHELDSEVISTSQEQVGLSPPREGVLSIPICASPSPSTIHGEGGPSHSPIRSSSPPSYADITRKKQPVSLGSSEDDTFEQHSKKGRKSKKEIREEEAERLKVQGSQSTLKMSYGRNTIIRPPKEVNIPSHLGK